MMPRADVISFNFRTSDERIRELSACRDQGRRHSEAVHLPPTVGTDAGDVRRWGGLRPRLVTRRKSSGIHARQWHRRARPEQRHRDNTHGSFGRMAECLPAGWSRTRTHRICQESSDDDDYDNYRQLFVMNADGTDQHQVPNSDSFAHNPSWSPDGSTLLYSHRYYGRGYCEDVILSIHPDGSQPRRVMKQGCLSAAGTWSPTGARVAVVMGGPEVDFDAGDDPRLTGIWTVRPDGTGHRRLVVRHGWDPAWQPTAVRGSRRALTREQANSRAAVWRSPRPHPTGGTSSPCALRGGVCAD